MRIKLNWRIKPITARCVYIVGESIIERWIRIVSWTLRTWIKRGTR